MEKIKIAIEKAKLENAQVRLTTSAEPVSPIEEQKVDAEISLANRDIDKISYNKTAVVKLDQSNLERNRIVSHAKQSLQ